MKDEVLGFERPPVGVGEVLVEEETGVRGLRAEEQPGGDDDLQREANDSLEHVFRHVMAHQRKRTAVVIVVP